MEGVGSRLGRASARYGPTQTVFNGPVRKWKKKWVHVSSASQSNGHSTTTTNNNGSPLLLCKWTPLPSNPSEKGGALPEEPPKRRFRYTPVSACMCVIVMYMYKDSVFTTIFICYFFGLWQV